MTQEIILGCDLGMGAIKSVTNDGKSQLPSFVSTPSGSRIASTEGVRGAKASLLIEHDGGTFYVGRNAHNDGTPVENLDEERLLGSPEIKALFYGALTQHGIPGGAIVKPLIGLPIGLLGEDNKRTTQAKMKSWLTGEHTWQANGKKRSVTINEVGITSQPAGALLDLVYDDEGQRTPYASMTKKEIGIVSIGFKTIEILVLNGGKMTQRFSGSSNNGVRRLLEITNNSLYSLGELDDMLRAGTLDTDGAIEAWARIVGGDIEKQWGDSYKRFERIVFCGGGSILLRNHLTKYQAKAHYPDDPVFSIASGLYKQLLVKAKKNG